MKKGNLKALNMEDLTKKLAGLREDLRALHFKAEGARSKNVKEEAALRKEIARALTFINEQKQNAKK